MAAEVTDRLWERKVARHYHQVQGLTEFRQGSLVLVAPSGNCDALTISPWVANYVRTTVPNAPPQAGSSYAPQPLQGFIA
jgi:hypothetical protein